MIRTSSLFAHAFMLETDNSYGGSRHVARVLSNRNLSNHRIQSTVEGLARRSVGYGRCKLVRFKTYRKVGERIAGLYLQEGLTRTRPFFKTSFGTMSVPVGFALAHAKVTCLSSARKEEKLHHLTQGTSRLLCLRASSCMD